MSKKPKEAEYTTAMAIEQLEQQQIPRIPATQPLPFLTEPAAAFRSGRTPEELAESQDGQLIAAPPPKRSPPVMDLAR
jgi:hypothetical protein